MITFGDNQGMALGDRTNVKEGVSTTGQNSLGETKCDTHDKFVSTSLKLGISPVMRVITIIIWMKWSDEPLTILQKMQEARDLQ